MHINYEFKARCDDTEKMEALLQPLNPRFAGTDHQVDTYFYVSHGRLKLREGNIENALIHYHRSNTAGPKQSDVILYQHHPDTALKKILEHSLGVKVVVDKKRKIYFIDNVKFHFDQVKEQLTRKPRPFPQMKINPGVTSIDDFKYEDFTVGGYDPLPPIKGEVTVVGGF